MTTPSTTECYVSIKFSISDEAAFESFSTTKLSDAGKTTEEIETLLYSENPIKGDPPIFQPLMAIQNLSKLLDWTGCDVRSVPAVDWEEE